MVKTVFGEQAICFMEFPPCQKISLTNDSSCCSLPTTLAAHFNHSHLSSLWWLSFQLSLLFLASAPSAAILCLCLNTPCQITR